MITWHELEQARRRARLSQTELAGLCARVDGRTAEQWRPVINRAESGARELTQAQEVIVCSVLGIGTGARAALDAIRPALTREGRLGAVVALRRLADEIEAGR